MLREIIAPREFLPALMAHEWLLFCVERTVVAPQDNLAAEAVIADGAYRRIFFSAAINIEFRQAVLNRCSFITFVSSGSDVDKFATVHASMLREIIAPREFLPALIALEWLLLFVERAVVAL